MNTFFSKILSYNDTQKYTKNDTQNYTKNYVKNDTPKNAPKNISKKTIEDDEKEYKKANASLLSVIDIDENDDWKYYANIKNKINVYVNIKHTIKGQGCVCGIGYINSTPKIICDAIRNSDNWNKFDDKLENFEYIDVSESKRIIHLMFKSILAVISKRDMVFIETVTKEQDGTIIITSNRTNCDIYEENVAYRRLDMIAGGWILSPTVDGLGCTVFYYSHVDFKLDYVNKMLMDLIASKIPSVILKINDIVNEEDPS